MFYITVEYSILNYCDNINPNCWEVLPEENVLTAFYISTIFTFIDVYSV